MPKRTGISEAPLQDPTNRNKGYLVPVLVTETNKEPVPGAMSIETIALYSRAGANANPGTGATPADLTAEAQIRFDQDTLLRNSITTLNTNLNTEVETRHSEDQALVTRFQAALTSQRTDIDENAGDIARIRLLKTTGRLYVNTQEPSSQRQTTLLANATNNNPAIWFIPYATEANRVNPTGSYRLSNDNVQVRNANGLEITNARLANGNTNFAAGTIIRITAPNTYRILGGLPSAEITATLLNRLTGDDRIASSSISGLNQLILDTIQGTHPIIVRRTMPNIERIAGADTNSLSFRSTLWVVVNDQRLGDNTVGSLIDNPVGRGALVDGSPIPTEETIASRIQLRAGTMLRPRTLTSWRVIVAPAATAEIIEELELASGTQRLTSRAIRGLKAGVRTNEPNIHPIITSKAMPTVAQSIAARGSGATDGHAIWIINEDQANTDNRAAATIINGTGKGALVNGLVIPPSTRPASNLQLQAGTMLRIGTNDAYEVIWAPPVAGSGQTPTTTSTATSTVIAQADMPTEATLQAIINNLPEHGIGLWVVTANQTARANRANAQIRAQTRGLAQLNGTEIPAFVSNSSFISFKTGTVLSFRTTTAFNVVSAEKTITSIRNALAALVGDRRIPASAISGVIDYSINSPQLEFPLNGHAVSWAHGLTTPPTQIFAKAVCLIANHGYAFGDEVQITPHNIQKSNLWADATNITLMNFDMEMQSKATDSRFFPGSVAQAGITNGQWRIVLTGLL